MQNEFDMPEGTTFIEIVGVYDGWSIAKLPDGSLVNRWPAGSTRFTQVQEVIEEIRRGEQPL